MCTLKSDDLEDIGVDSAVHRNKIYNAWQTMMKANTLPPAVRIDRIGQAPVPATQLAEHLPLVGGDHQHVD